MSAETLIQFERSPDCTIARFAADEISSLREIDQPLDEFEKEIEEHRPKVLIIDFSGIQFVATTAINMLLIIVKRIRTYGGEVYLCNLSPPVQRVFDVMQLNILFEIFPDRQAALAKIAEKA